MTTNNLKPIEETINHWAEATTKALEEYADTYWPTYKALEHEWKEEHGNTKDFWYSRELRELNDRYGALGRTAVHDGMNTAKAKIAKEGARKLANITKKCEQIGGVKDTEWLHVGGKYGEVEGWILGNDGRWLHVQTIFAGGYNIQCLHLRFLCKVVKHH